MNFEEIEKEIQSKKLLKSDKYSIYLLFISYCHSKGIGIYSNEAYNEIIRLFPKNENEKLYNYCIWMWSEQID